jgi:CheY-like chemotaxis protein
MDGLRSVNQFACTKTLQEALSHNNMGLSQVVEQEDQSGEHSHGTNDVGTSSSATPPNTIGVGDGPQTVIAPATLPQSSEKNPAIVEPEHLDWFLHNADPQTAKSQTVENETQRLLALKSYQVLDEELPKTIQTQLTRYVTLAKETFQVEVAFVTLIDLGRAVFLAQTGLPVPPIPRKSAFCSHALLWPTDHDAENNDQVFEVRDARQDDRFRSFSSVAEPPHVRYYAASPLVSPEGWNIGVFGITGMTPRPEGLTKSERRILSQLGLLTMETLVQYRTWRKDQASRTLAAQNVASIAHNVLTPLMGVQLSLSLLTDNRDLRHTLTSTQKECLDTAATCAKTMGEICERLQVNEKAATPTGSIENSSCTSSHKLPENSLQLQDDARFKVPGLVAQLNTLLNNTDVPHQVPVTVVVDYETVPKSVHGDSSVLLPLATYILEKCCDRATFGTVQFCITVENYESIPQLMFSCSYDHMMSEDSVPNIEDDNVWKSLKTSLTSFLRGTTLGWQAAARQLRAEGGDIGVTDSRGDGSIIDSSACHKRKIWFRLPLLILEAELWDRKKSVCEISNTNETDDEYESTPLKRALVIDDSKVVRKILANALSRLGFETMLAVNGLEGLRALQESTYDLVLCDLLMPVMDGLDCVRSYRHWESNNRSTPQHIVAMSAHASEVDIERCLKLGMDCYYSKPITMETLKILAHDIEEYSNCTPLKTTRAELATTSSPTSTFAVKRRRTYSDAADRKSCLVACCNEIDASTVCHVLQEHDWTIKIAKHSKVVLELLKERNWGLVFVDSDRIGHDNISCMHEFRVWEKHHRVRRQRNIYLLMVDLPQPRTSSLLQLPAGVDGAVHKPARPDDIGRVLQTVVKASGFDARDIIVST